MNLNLKPPKNYKDKEEKWESLLNEVSVSLAKSDAKFDKTEHINKSRLAITKLFLKWYFCLIVFGFIFSAGYNFMVAKINLSLLTSNATSLDFIDVGNTVALITSTLSSGVGFVIGYYFKNKDSE
ncbi:MAG: hypothetical protein PQ612_02185 [Rickettsiales bacterium]|nr:hypothetical protein [Pseudomonadota bacterium]MDA0967065.1 hypothetical protein [Pseudomonadota bacterium]MDG4542449.1 hypothetical protein [Rickettsiales bacterium]MDG4544953.1 hypothetical protein [Rickettsiales bacterium]MDG4547076.1 hypothetical protein [Rickettsiales bacterium]